MVTIIGYGKHVGQGGWTVDIVLVHGGWIDGSSWLAVIDGLRARGLTARAVQLGNNSFADDVAAVGRMLDHWGNEAILIGHSYGGAVITAAGVHPLVMALGYISASAPGDGEGIAEVVEGSTTDELISLPPVEDGFVWMDARVIATLSPAMTDVEMKRLLAVQRPFNASIFNAAIHKAAWKGKPSWYLVAERDAFFPPRVQKALAGRIGATVRLEEVDHLSPLTAPTEVAAFISWAREQALTVIDKSNKV